MEENFKILVHRNDDKLHLKLGGKFDKNAARKLIGLVEGYAGKFSAIFIHTSGLDEVNPSSLEACRAAMLYMQCGSTMITATGDHGADLVPESLHFNFIDPSLMSHNASVANI